MRPWEANVRRVVPYVPGDQPKGSKLIKLNTNENPYPPAPGAERAIREMDTDRLRKYPDPTVSDLVEVLAEYYGVGTDQVFVGVGSDDVIAMSFLTFFNSPKPVLFPDITYSFYKVWADLYRIPYETPKLDGDFSIIPRDYKRENGGVIFPNPNAPTGVYMPLDQVEDIIKANQDAVVIVDEAYIDFAGPSALGLIGTYDNLLVVQTFSKSRSMAGLRIGFAVGNPALIKALNDVKYSYNSYTMNLPSIVMGVESVKDREYFEDITGKITATRERAKIRLRELGFTFPDSKANFIFASHKSVPAAQIFEALKKEQIYVRYFDGERLDNSLRISIGTDEEMETLFAFLERFLGEQ
ncbi:histidinol-phosphate transaminase [Enterocloster citroniae]|jgi:histidinol-phosphate aminotransferase|uniref:Histidinol-phosphate aminotransferase n=2 Tax=Enterocloster citroniae TaxID=358743 RepID=A0ABV2FRD4_9FIRM|nr:histidinol-phosphate transaminase [Enterocloster citroniae]KMW16660.1 histidinol-phosphate aminotransferase [[Clostridium] citroniae WAL-19142]MCB7062390.1 histidinol-phosphate transaminase [Enterocloster citroniae]MCC8084965.1 histidinol-phosphate transaminase [Clostridium sp.]SCH07115.1 Histidinol-phosphate aminotransferase [uncultured Clostridium sp.]